MPGQSGYDLFLRGSDEKFVGLGGLSFIREQKLFSTVLF